MFLPSIKTERELIALAIALERRAANRFKNLSLRMAELGRSDLSGLFDGLAREEEDHAKELMRLPSAADLEAGAPDRAATAYLPDTEDRESGDLPDRDSVYACLATAVKNEQKAFEFFSYIAATAEDEGVQRLAESLASEELGHARLLRGLRRQAYRRLMASHSPWPKPTEIQSLGDLSQAALEGEGALAVELRLLSRDFAGLESVVTATEERLASLQPDSPAGSETGTGNRSEAVSAEQPTPLPAGRLRPALDQAQDAFAFYDAVVSAASTEEVMLAAQSLSDHALERIKRLKQIVGQDP